MATIQVENLPQELTALDQWVAWRSENGTKVPINARTGEKAKSNDSSTWSTFAEACTALQRGTYDGIGFMFHEYDPYTGGDLDDCIREDGTIAPVALGILASMDTYSEISPSGTGVKFWVKGKLPKNLGVTPIGDGVTIELYDHVRFFTMTGKRLPGTPDTIRTVDSELTQLYDHVRPARAATPAPSAPPRPTQDTEHVRRYALAALEYEHQNMLAAQDGERHSTRLRAAFALAGYIPHITEQEIIDALSVNFGPNEASARKTIADGIAAGRDEPRVIPEPTYSAINQVDCLPDSTDDELHTLDAEQLRQRLRAVEAERDQWRRQAEHLDKWRKWTLDLAAVEGKRLSPAAKVVALSLWPEIKSRESRQVDEPQRIYIEEAKDKAGLSAGTYGTRLKELESAGAIVRIEERQPNGHKKVLIQPTAAFSLPAAWGPEMPRNHGGADRGAGRRPAPDCPSCGTTAPVVEKRTTVSRYHCGNCETPLSVSEPRQDVHLWQLQNQDDYWTSQRIDPHAITQVAQIEEDSSPSPIPQLGDDDGASEPDTENQLDCWLAAVESDPAPALPTGATACAAPPDYPANDQRPDVPQIRIVQAWRYKQNAQGLAQGATP